MTSFDAGIAALNKANELATTKPSCIHRQDNTTNSNPLSQLIQTGWNFISGAATTKAITFATAFDTIPIIILTPLGGLNGSDPATMADFNIHLQNMITAYPVSTTGFTANIDSTAANWRYGFTWIAVGTKG